jgi:abhydrolase domain-containing protein 6
MRRASPAASTALAISALAAPALAAVVFMQASCAPLLVALKLGEERGKAGLLERQAPDGISYLERHAREPAAVVVMLHGFGGNKDHWTYFSQHLPEELRLIAPDLPGFGDSPKSEAESYDVDSQVGRLERFLAERGVLRFHLMGSSMGGRIAAHYALAHPEQVQTLVLFDPAGIRGPLPGRKDELARNGKDPLVIETVEDFDRLLELSFVTPPTFPDFVKAHLAEQGAKHGAFSAKVMADLDRVPRDLRAELPGLAPPTLVVWGAQDELIHPSAAALWREAVPGHTVVILPETGHVPQIERPAESAALVLTWWRQVLPGADAAPR